MKNPIYQIASFLLLFLLPLFMQAKTVDSLQSPVIWLQEQNRVGQDLLKNSQEFSSTIAFFEKAYKFAQKNDLTNKVPGIAIGYGIALYRSGDFKNSYSILLDILPQLDENRLSQRAEVNQILGMNLYFRDKYSEAYRYQVEALKYYTSVNDSKGMMNVYYDLGTNFGGQQQPELELEYFQKGIAIAKELNDTKMIILGTTAIGGAWGSLKDFDKALSWSDKSIELAKSINDNEELGWASIHRGHILGQIEKYKEAEYYLKQAYDLSFEIENQLLTGYALEQLSDIYIKQNKLPEALKKLDESRELFQIMGQTNSEKSVIKKYAEIYFKLGDYNKYKAYTDQYIAIKDSIYSKELVASISDLKQDYEIHKMEKENQFALLKKDQELKNAKNYFAIAIICGASLVLMLLLALLYIRNKSANEKNELLTAKNAEILRQNEILASSNKDLEKFAYIISHDLKEPLRNINGFTKLLSRKIKKYQDPDIEEYSEFITKGTAQMSELLSGLLEYSKLSSNKAKTSKVSTQDVVSDVVSNLKIQLLEKNCTIEIGELPDIYFGKTQLTQIFQNLIANAIKFAPDQENKISITAKDKGDCYRFAVRDNGIGIAKEYQKEIFVVFQRLHDRGTYSGSGIGLATCKKIVEDQGGEIWVKSKEGNGSCFYFTVPKDCVKPLISVVGKEEKVAAELV